MAILDLTSSFIKYNLTPSEYLEGCKFNLMQKSVIQNLISEIAEEKITLKFDPLTPSIFLQREAELAGQLSILKYLLDLESINPEVPSQE
jgi:hypothetical protein